jgi:hypothetical protein
VRREYEQGVDAEQHDEHTEINSDPLPGGRGTPLAYRREYFGAEEAEAVSS